MITRDQIQEMFDGAKDYPWDIHAQCVWGYFFADADQEKLIAAAPHLEEKGFAVVGLLTPSPEDDDQETILLHVERSEAHTVESLYELNAELYNFAETHGLQSYDGMDVGPCE